MPSMIPPRYGTARDPTVPTVGRTVAGVARALGTPLQPWQSYVADVTGEVDSQGRPRYRTVVLVVPRRAGKTTLVLPTLLQRSIARPAGRCWYTAQDRETAARLWREEWAGPLRALPGVKMRASNGSETLRFVRRGSTLALFAPGPRALHSQDADAVCVDEAWAFSRERGAALLQAIVGAQSRTGRHPQTWIVSAGGDHDSTWLADWMDRGRALTDGIAYFEWSADPATDDLTDPQVWQRVHPGGVTVEDMRAALDTLGVDEFARMYLSVFTDTSGGAAVPLPADLWAARAAADGTSHGRYRHLAFDVAPDRSTAALAGASLTADGHVLVELLWHGPATVLPDELRRRMRPRGGKIATLHGAPSQADMALRLPALPITTARPADYVAACQRLVDLAVDGTLTHRAPALTALLADAARTWRGDAWVWSARNTDADITPLAAVTLAAWAASDTPARAQVVTVAS